MGARDEILARIRAAGVPDDAATVSEPGAPRPGDVELFVARLVDYKANVVVCGPADMGQAVAEVLGDTGTLVTPDGVPAAWLADFRGTIVEEPVEITALDQPGVSVLTGCAVAIAQTGTLVLDAGPGQGRRALTLVPDHHVCVVHKRQIFDDVPDALAALENPTRPLTLISGPSATSDIELNRVEGVHGPRRLDVVIVLD
ncbi:LutC/YkgG family protein [Allorhizocola rhizosphaerae]|uniref:LutC/YkgG family protein n=1 Tax=Allorhizocola rhizosphaerae TaxID=1872709 RepID=UPI0013C34250|nr:LUD domain-containing protein [Allorhizocola rhizosphaerae]